MKSILAGLLVFGISTLCEKAKPNPFAGMNIHIKANNTFCGAIGSVEEQNGYLIFTRVMLDKHKIGEIFSNGFIVKPAQRIGMEIEVLQNGEIKKYSNVWIEEMTPYEEGQDTVLIEKMACVVETTDAAPEQLRLRRRLESIQQNIKLRIIQIENKALKIMARKNEGS